MTEFNVTRAVLFQAFGLRDDSSFARFREKLSSELFEKLPSSATVDTLEVVSTWSDSGGNRHLVFRGIASAFNQSHDFGGEFVWLKGLGSFRGKIWSRLDNPTDLHLSIKARDAFRNNNFQLAYEYYNSIAQPCKLPPPMVRLKDLIEKHLEKE